MLHATARILAHPATVFKPSAPPGQPAFRLNFLTLIARIGTKRVALG
jgi:hypothetical protein